ncbi:MAG: CAP domain-containing protein [Candidatus Pacebacteria bacterium]|nr:CAP domain-containing protein [Candidatus Paceibacterota bacterium]
MGQDLPPEPPSEEAKAIVIANGQAAALRKRKARRNLVLIIIGTVVVAGIVWGIQALTSSPLARVASFQNSLATKVQQDVSAYPAPLKATSTAAARVPKKSSTLTIAGVIANTNAQRAENGNMPPLTESKTLDAIATLRLDDMFQNQYFAHVNSSTGQSAVTVAASVGYDNLALGENLAEGTFAGDAGVVTAWMNSPGHRANILGTHYTEIGVAVREGTFQGQDGWIAVQIFGKPVSACPPAPSDNLKAAIAAAEATLTSMGQQLTEMKASIDAMRPQSGDAYNAQVQQYNTLVGQYNTLGTQTKTQADTYNAEVDAFNACL